MRVRQAEEQGLALPRRAHGPRYLVIYDGACPYCRATASWLQSHDTRNALRTLPFQTPRLLDALGISHEEAERSLQVVAPLGRPRWQGAEALVVAAGALPGFGWLRGAWRIAPLRPPARVGYRLFAALRPREACAACEAVGRGHAR